MKCSPPTSVPRFRAAVRRASRDTTMISLIASILQRLRSPKPLDADELQSVRADVYRVLLEHKRRMRERGSL